MKSKLLRNAGFLFVAVCVSAALSFGQTKAPEKKTTAPASTEKAAKKDETKKDAAKKSEQKGAQIDINSATKQELMTLPGIGDAYAQKIIDNRPYRAKNQLTQKNVVPQGTYDKIADQIIAKQNTAASEKGTKTGGEKKETTKKKS